MAYTPNIANPPGWTASDAITTTSLDNFETIYSEASSYLASHTHDALYYTRTEMEASFWYSGTMGHGAGSDADLIYKSTGNLHAAGFAGLGVATGLIILWYGATGAIPSGWHICDGNAGTVNLLDRMPVGAGTGSGYSVGNTGGSATFTATGSITVDSHIVTAAEMGTHRHPFSELYCPTAGNVNSGAGWSGALSSSSGSTSAAGGGSGHGHIGSTLTGNAVNSMPYFKALCYIQKT